VDELKPLSGGGGGGGNGGGVSGVGGIGGGGGGVVPGSPSAAAAAGDVFATFRAITSFNPFTDLPITSHLRTKRGRHTAAVVRQLLSSDPAARLGGPVGRGLHSSTSQLNLSRF
jgi:hypothetical protein